MTLIQAAEIKRPKTNLTVNPAYQLDKQRMKTGFMGVFNWAYVGDARKTLLKLALAPLMNTSVIPLGKRPAAKNAEQRQARKAENAKLRAWQAKRQEQHLNYYTKLKKINAGADSYFQLTLPITIFSDVNDLDQLFFMFSGTGMTDDARHEAELMIAAKVNQRYPASAALQRSGLPGSTVDIFKSTLLAVEYDFGDKSAIASLVFKITQEEAQALVSQDWVEIRPVDLYPLFSMWVEAEYVSRDYSKAVVSLSKIAQTLPKHNPDDERIDQYGIGIDLDGDPIWLPRQCNDTQKYESMFAAASVGQDGNFALRTVNNEAVPHLPANIPILVDWVNYKFTYSNSAGKPVLMPLEHMRKCNASMAMNILKRPIPGKFLERLQHYAEACSVPTNVRSYGADQSATVEDYWKAREAAWIDAHNTAPRYLELTYDTEDPLLDPIRRFVAALYEGIQNHMEAMNTKYAVSTMIQTMGILSVIVKYGANMGQTRVAANTIREKAAKQDIDPNWQPPEMPLITKKFDTPESGLLPHQAKVRNLLKESPDFAILSVDAGGGKSMLSITDILYEIKAGRSAPYLIMCPSHLVANYVSELVEFTDGQVNVIPVTSYNIRTTGIARYEAILKEAPINTVLVVDYDVLKFRVKSMGYGTSSIPVYPVIEMIRQFKPGYVMLDESHFLRNMKSRRTRSVMSFIADIPKKRLASGTLNPDSPSDLPGQMAILDPTIFGTREAFNERYGEDVRGNRVMKWRTNGPNSIATVLPELKQTVVWASAKRKEWACALPKRQDFFVAVELTDNQRRMYNAIFDDMIQQIRKDAESNKHAKKLLEKLVGKTASATDEEDFGDLGEDGDDEDESDDLLDDSSDVGPALQPYLADIERFVTDPTSHPYSKNGIVLSNGERVPPLTGDDLRMPKAIALQHIMEKHFAKNDGTKVLIFVNYYQSAESLFNAMPEELKASGLLYQASSKTEMVNRFKTDKSVKWMIGIRRSLEVGLNLQQASVLIRCEGVWTPGEQEQGDSRIARPYFGPGGDKRAGLEFYTLVADRTIDITKAARLRAKMVALAKFENTGNPNYEAIPDIPIIPMNLETIQTQNDFSANLEEYQTSMAALNEVIATENEEYKQKITAEGGFHFTQVKKGQNPAGAALLSRVPYAQGTELYKASELGLVRVDNYLGMELAAEDDDDEVGGDETENESETIAKQREMLIGMRCHCEFGDGVIIGAAAIGNTSFISRINVRLDDGTSARKLRATNVFVVTRKETNSIDMRNKLAQASGLEITSEITVPGTVVRETKLTVKELKERARQKEIEERKRRKVMEKTSKAIDIELQMNLVNGYLRLSYVGDDARTTKALEAVGFKLDQPYFFTRIRNARHLLKQAQLWADGGFETTSQVDNDALALLSDELSKGGLQTHRHYQKLVSRGNFNNVLRTIWKPTSDKRLLNMFAMVTDGGAEDASVVRQAEKQGLDPSYAIAYLCLPAGPGHPGSRLAIGAKYKAPGTRWYQSNPALSMFVGSLRGAQHVLFGLRDAGISVNNIAELNTMMKSVKRVAPKQDQHVDLTDEMVPDEVQLKKKSKTK